MMPLITALVDTYNHEEYIEQALDSVLDQGLSPNELEVVVVDDGSNDRTPEILKRYSPRVKLIQKPNGGQASAFNVGFGESRGEFIAILDGDDWWARGKLQRVLTELQRNPEISTVSHGFYEFDDETKAVSTCQPLSDLTIRLDSVDSVRTAHDVWRFFLPSGLTFRRNALKWIFPLPGEMRFMADTPIQVAAMLEGASVLREPLFYYRHHTRNLFAIEHGSREKMQRKREMAKIVRQKLPQMLLQHGVKPELVWGLLLPQEEYWFQFDPPGRARLFWFHMRTNYHQRRRQNWRFTILNCVTAFGALLFGYKNQNAMYDWRKRVNGDLTHWYRRATSAERNFSRDGGPGEDD